MGSCWRGSSGSEMGPIAGSCARGNKFSDSLTFGDFLTRSATTGVSNRTLPTSRLLGITANKQLSSSVVRRSKWPCVFQDCRYMAIYVILIWCETKMWSRKVNFGAALTRSSSNWSCNRSFTQLSQLLSQCQCHTLYTAVLFYDILESYRKYCPIFSQPPLRNNLGASFWPLPW